MPAKHEEDDEVSGGGAPGIGVDARGGGVVDPTKNVLDLVKAESRYQDGMRDSLEKIQNFAREADAKLQDFARDSESRLQTSLRGAESTRIDQLAELRQIYETRIADMLSASVQSTSSLVSTQLVQIQATFDARVSKLEQFRWESGGRSSVSDPALAESLNKMAISIAALKTTETATTNRTTGRSDMVAWIVAGVLAFAAIAGPIIAVMALRPR